VEKTHKEAIVVSALVRFVSQIAKNWAQIHRLKLLG
jgi:hypothetical protein